MIYAVYRAAPAATATWRTFAATPAVPVAAGRQRTLQLGERVLVVAPDDAPALVARGRGDEREKDGRIDDAGLDTLHLVTQQGRCFQKRHPEVPVLLDGGRHLVVSLRRHHAAEIADPSPASYAISPLTDDEILVEPCPCPSPRPTPDPAIVPLVGKVNRYAFKSIVTTLATYHTRHSLTHHYRSAAAWAADRLKALGYQVRTPEFIVKETATYPQGRCSNVVADKAGSGTGARGLVIVCAHLDAFDEHAPKSEIATAIAPGADDNATGSAGVLEMARVFAGVSTTHDLRFILFGGEEQVLLGSKHYTTNLSMRDRMRLLAVVNMDMIGVDNVVPALPTVLLEGGPVSRPMMEELCAAAHAYTDLIVSRTFKPWGSDHVPFLAHGLQAALTIEGYDRANKNVHSAADTLEHIDSAFAAQILRMNVAFVAMKAGLAPPPAA